MPKKKRGTWPMPLRFEANYGDPSLAFDPLVDEVFAELKSSFLEMPRGDGFVDYATFEKGYQALKRSTDAFVNVTPATVVASIELAPIAFVVFRAILGFTPPEWAYVTTEMTGVTVDQGRLGRLIETCVCSRSRRGPSGRR